MMGLGLAEILVLGFLCVLFFVGILATVIGLLVFGSRHRPPAPFGDRPGPRMYARADAPLARHAPDDHDSRLDLVARITRRFCPRCRTPLADDFPQGLCPACLLAAGIESEPIPRAVDGVAVTTPLSGSHPPLIGEIDDLQPSFPTLEILELLGRGGMGAVYKARQKNLDRLVALKVIPPEAAKDPTFTERFNREARALARLNHPNIVTVYDFGQAGDVYYLLMEYIDGVNLRQAQRAERLAPAEALAIVPQICDALQYAHDQGVVHRDIKPENVLLDRSGRVKIADFGLAKLIGKGPDDFTLTGTQQVMGTPRYMAPEQIERPSAVDHRADIYSLGVVIYEMLTGELPVGRFPAPSERVEVDVRIDQVVLRTLEKEPDRRYQRASQVKTELASATGLPPRERALPPIATPPAARTSAPFPSPPPKRMSEHVGPPAPEVIALVAIVMTIGLLLMIAGMSGLTSYPFRPAGSRIEAWWLAYSLALMASGAAATIGSWLTYRQLPGSTSPLRSATITWFDWLIGIFAALGVVAVLLQFAIARDDMLIFFGIPGVVSIILASAGILLRYLLRGAREPAMLYPAAASSPPLAPALLVPTLATAAIFLLLWVDIGFSQPGFDPEVNEPVTPTEVNYVNWKRAMVLLGLAITPSVFALSALWRMYGPRDVREDGSEHVRSPFASRWSLILLGGVGVATLLLPWFRLEVQPLAVVSLDLNDVFPKDARAENRSFGSNIVREGSLRHFALMPAGWRFAHRGATLERAVLFAVFCAALAAVAAISHPQLPPIRNGLAIGCGLLGLVLVTSLVHQAADRHTKLLVDPVTMRGLEQFARDSLGRQPQAIEAWRAPASQAFHARPAVGLIVAGAVSGLLILAGVWNIAWGEKIAAGEPNAARRANAAGQPPFTETPMHRLVHGPAVGLMVVGVLGILFPLLAACAAASLVPVRDEIIPAREQIQYSHAAAVIGGRMLVRPEAWATPLGLLAQNAAFPEPSRSYPYGVFGAGAGAFFVLAINLPVSVLVFIGGWRMRRLQSYGLAVTASILSILPCTLVWIIALPLGLWSLVVLARPDVRTAFES
jgi:serine/threonine protein kinase